MWLILYPNQTYEFAPVMAVNGSLRVTVFNTTAYSVANSKLDVYGNPVELPVRARYLIGGIDVSIVARVPANSIIVFNINPSNDYQVETNATDFYVYFTNNNPNNATVLYPVDDLALAHYGIRGEISLYEPVTLTSPTTNTATTTTTTTLKTTTPTTFQTTTTSTSGTSTTFQSTTTSFETTFSTSTSETTTYTYMTTFTTTTPTTTSESITNTSYPTSTEPMTSTPKGVEGLTTELLLIMGLVGIGIGIGVFATVKKR